MRRLIRRALLLTLVAGVTAACGSSNSSLPTGPTIQPTILTETFAGTLTKNAAYTHPFAVGDAGDVTVFLLQSVDPANPTNSGFPLGVSLGTWNGSTCAIVIANDGMVPTSAAAPQSPLTGRATAATNLCVRVYDVGFVSGSANYELLIDHY